MEKIEIFEKHLNGTLDENYAENFYSQLAQDQELRAEFKTFAKVKNNIKSGMSSFAPSAALKASVLSNSQNHIAAATTATATKAALFSSNTILMSILSGVIGAIIIYFLMPKNTMNNEISSKNIPTVKENIIKYDTPVIIYEIDEPIQQNITQSINVEKNIHDKDEDKSANKLKKIDEVNFASNYNGISSKTNEFLNNSIAFEEESFNPIFNNSINQSNNINIELNGNLSQNIPKATIEPENYSELNNVNLNVFYRFNKAFQAGVYLSQETFFVQYEGTDEIGSLFRYSQQPNLFTFGAIARYSLLETKYFDPYIQGSLGMNRAGFVLAPAVGLEIMYLPEISFNIGLNYKLFWFQHQNNWFNTNKYGLNYGITFKL